MAPVNTLTNTIARYSARNKHTNKAEPYSMLNPLTNSDSASLKSNGARFVSATTITNQKSVNGGIVNPGPTAKAQFLSLNSPLTRNKYKIKKAADTS